jgi:outer membrane receptor for ferrienterochelin and colicin
MKLILIAFILCSTSAIAQTSSIRINETGAKISLVSDSGKAKSIRLCCNDGKTAKSLYIVNGFVFADSLISQIIPNQIKSIEVLKNTAAIEKYGNKAKNGVVIITAKPEAVDELTRKGVLKPVL